MDIELETLSFITDLKDLVFLIEEGVSSDLFFDINHKEVFDFSYDYLINSGFTLAPTLDLIEEVFPAWFGKVEWPEKRHEKREIIDRLKEKYRRVRLQTVLRELASETVDNPENAVKLGLESFSSIQFESSTSNRVLDYAETYPDRVREYYERVLEDTNQEPETGIPLWWPEVTEYTFGLRQSEVAILVALPNVGKTWLMLKAALEAARAGYTVYLANLELASTNLAQMRLDCFASGVPFSAYERGTLTLKQSQKLEDAREELSELKGKLIIDSPKRPAERGVYELYTRARFMGADIVIGDQLSWVTPRGNYTGSSANTQVISEVITDITNVSREMGIASLWAAQFSRAAGTLKKGRGGLQHIALSTTVEQIVDWAFSLTRSEEMRENEAILLEILKSRRTDLETWMCSWKLRDETSLEVIRPYRDS